LLKKALELPANSVLFFIVPKNEMVEDAAVIQGLAYRTGACRHRCRMQAFE
jgi:hypothetical protein